MGFSNLVARVSTKTSINGAVDTILPQENEQAIFASAQRKRRKQSACVLCAFSDCVLVFILILCPSSSCLGHTAVIFLLVSTYLKIMLCILHCYRPLPHIVPQCPSRSSMINIFSELEIGVKSLCVALPLFHLLLKKWINISISQLHIFVF